MLVDKVSKLTIIDNEKEHIGTFAIWYDSVKRKKVEIERSRDDKCSNTW